MTIIEGTGGEARRSWVGLPTSLIAFIASTQETLLVKARDLDSGCGNKGKVKDGNESVQSTSSLLLAGTEKGEEHCTKSMSCVRGGVGDQLKWVWGGGGG